MLGIPASDCDTVIYLEEFKSKYVR